MTRQFLFGLAAAVCAALFAAANPKAESQANSSAGQTPSRPVMAAATGRVTLYGNVHPLATAANDRGPVPDSLSLNNMYLLLLHTSTQQLSLQNLLQQQQNPHSPQYHQWLTPEQFAQSFGPSNAEIAAVSSWLQAQGLQAESTARGHAFIRFSGTAGAVGAAFNTQIHYFEAAGVLHRANISNPQLPGALASSVGGVWGFNDFQAKPLHKFAGLVKKDKASGGWSRASGGQSGVASDAQPLFTNSSNPLYDLGPTDFATIYNVLPLWNANIDGSGETIALPEQSDIDLQDVRGYRFAFGLPVNDPQILVPPGTTNPGQTEDGDEDEALLDTEIAGAVAKNATILVVPQSNVTDAISYVVDNDVAPIISVSFGECELGLGTSGNQFFGGGGGTIGVWQQAAAEGITVMVSAGDAGSTGCEDFDSTTPVAARQGLAVSGFASTPYNVAVGGTDFDDFNSYSTYWSSTNAPGTLASALSYIPEMTWNDSCGSSVVLQTIGLSFADTTNEALCNNPSAETEFLNVVAGSGGLSACTAPTGITPASCSGGYAQPSWQAGVVGVPSGGGRALPDVSLFAANGLFGHAYVICDSVQNPNSANCSPGNGGFTFAAFGGTSASSPAFAGIMALVAQKQISAANPDGRQGLANPVLYQLAANEFGSTAHPNNSSLASCNSSLGGAVGSACVFYDVTTGDNAVPCNAGSPNCTNTNSGDSYGIVESGGQFAYTTAAGFDLATGLGSVNAANLVNGWGGASDAAATSTVLSSSSNSIIQGSSVTFTATVASGAGTPTGSVSFLDGSTAIGTASLSAGKASLVSTQLAQGVHSVLAQYGGTAGFAASQSNPVTVTVTGPAASLSPTALSFGAQTVSTSSAAQLVTLSNTGSSTLTISSISVSGDFSDTTTCGGSLDAGSSCTISIIFTPAAEGTLNGTLSVSSNAGGSAAVVALSGLGDEPQASFSPGSLSFGNEAVGQTSSAQGVTLSNSGDGPLNISSTIASAPFFQINNCPSQLAAGGSCLINVSYSPTAAGSNSGSLAVVSNSFRSIAPVSLAGTAIGTPSLNIAPVSLSFGNQNLGTASVAQTITLTNSGTGQVDIFGISASGAFSAAVYCNTILGPGSSCTVNVTFSPTADGPSSGALVITSDAASSPNSVPLNGTGTGTAPPPAALAAISPASLAFGSQTVGTVSEIQNVTIANTGNAPLIISSISTSGDFMQTNSCGATVAANSACSVSVSFAPTSSGSLSGSLTIASSAAANPATVALSGTGLVQGSSSGSSSSTGGGNGTGSGGGSIGISTLLALLPAVLVRKRRRRHQA